jgi:hypothetical protein
MPDTILIRTAALSAIAWRGGVNIGSAGRAFHRIGNGFTILSGTSGRSLFALFFQSTDKFETIPSNTNGGGEDYEF